MADGPQNYEEDEDVIFKNSPLYRHLKITGFEDADIDVVDADRMVQQEQISPFEPKLQVVSLWTKLRTCFSYCVTVTAGFHAINDDILQLQIQFRNLILAKLCKSSVLEEDDQNFLDHYIGNIGENEKLTGNHQSVKSKLLLMILIPCLVSYSMNRRYYPDNQWSFQPVTDALAILTLAYLLLIVFKYLRLTYHRLGLQNKMDTVQSTLDMAESFLSHLKKSLRLIQETELIARGFTFVSQDSPVWRLEQGTLQNSQRLCPELRRILFLSARSTMLTFKSATRQLLDICPLRPEVDCVTNYLACLSLDDYGPCLQETGNDAQSSQHLHEITDGFSIASLKGINTLCSLHLSEFIRRLALCFDAPGDMSRYNYLTSSGLDGVLSQANTSLQSKLLTLTRCYDFHKCCVVTNEPKRPRCPQNKSLSPAQHLYTAVHSLDLHLQAALNKSRTLTSYLEPHFDDINTDRPDPTPDLPLWDSVLHQIKAELEAAKGCWEEAGSKMGTLGNRRDKGTREPSAPGNDPGPIAKHEALPVVCISGDPVIEDQVFEAYTDPETIDIDWEWELPMSAEEKAKKKKEKEEALRLLTELKTVISVRAVEREERERKALQKSRGIDSLGTCGDNVKLSENKISAGQDRLPCRDVTAISGLLDQGKGVATTNMAMVSNAGQCLQSQNIAGRSGHGDGHLVTVHGTETDLNNMNIGKSENMDIVRTAKQEVTDSDSEINRFVVDQNNDLLPSNRCDSLTMHPDAVTKLSSPHESSMRTKSETNGVFGVSETDSDEDDLVSVGDNVRDGKAGTLQIGLPIGPANQKALENRLGKLPGADLLFTANVAAMAVARSQQLCLNVQTFGDEEESGEEYLHSEEEGEES